MKISCPSCEKQIEWSLDNPARPFCSERCRLIDLGEWASDRHRIPCQPSEEQQIDGESIVPSQDHQPW